MSNRHAILVALLIGAIQSAIPWLGLNLFRNKIDQN